MSTEIIKLVTPKQLRAVKFCEFVLDVDYQGDLNNYKEVSNFLYNYLETAKVIMNDAIESYYGNFDW